MTLMGNQTMMNYLAHIAGVRRLTPEDEERLRSGNHDNTIVSSVKVEEEKIYLNNVGDSANACEPNLAAWEDQQSIDC